MNAKETSTRTDHAAPASAATVPNAPVREVAAAPRTITVEMPRGAGSFFGLGSVISVLLLFAAWMVVGIGYLCIPGSLAGAVLGVVLGLMNLGNGVAAAALCFGCGVACAGMFFPLAIGTQAARRALAAGTRKMFSAR